MREKHGRVHVESFSATPTSAPRLVGEGSDWLGEVSKQGNHGHLEGSSETHTHTHRHMGLSQTKRSGVPQSKPL